MTQPKKGHYSLIRICPHPSRQEFFNVGLFLCEPTSDFGDVKILTKLPHLAPFIKNSWIQKEIFGHALSAVEETIRQIYAEHKNNPQGLIDAFNFLFQRYVNEIRVEPLRSIKMLDPRSTFEDLFCRLIAPPTPPKAPKKKKNPIQHELDTFFRSHQGSPYVQLNLRFSLPFRKTDFEIPYAYKNGVWNFVKPVQISVSTEKAIFRYAEALVTECKLAIPQMKAHVKDTDAAILLLPTDEHSSQPDLLNLWEHFGLKVQRPSNLHAWFAEVETTLQEKENPHN